MTRIKYGVHTKKDEEIVKVPIKPKEEKKKP